MKMFLGGDFDFMKLSPEIHYKSDRYGSERYSYDLQVMLHNTLVRRHIKGERTTV